MRKPAIVLVAARKASVPAGYRGNAPAQLVCLALMLALFALAFRIATIW